MFGLQLTTQQLHKLMFVFCNSKLESNKEKLFPLTSKYFSGNAVAWKQVSLSSFVMELCSQDNHFLSLRKHPMQPE
jgi:hypothetical protein